MLRAEVKTITPIMAADMRGRSKNFRRLRPSVVQRYAADMRAGNWDLNGAPIIMNGTKVVDGQHRLAACEAAGVPFHTLVVSGCTSDVNLDQGPSRTFADWLAHEGYKNPHDLAAAVRLLWAHDLGDVTLAVRGKPTMRQAMAALERHPNAPRWTTQGRRAKEIMPSSIVIYTLCRIADTAGDDVAQGFIDQIIQPKGSVERCPAFRLRERMIKDRTAKARLPRVERLAVCLRAAQFWMDGRPAYPSSLRWIASGRKAQAFPDF